MPELPEVQTVVNDLNRKIKGYKIVDFSTQWKKSIKMSLTKFRKELIGRKIERVKRRGKNILIYLREDKVMLVHLKMTGHLLVKITNNKLQITKKKQKTKPKQKNKTEAYFEERVNQYIRHKWLLKKNKDEISLEFSDLRKFGKIRLIDKKDLKADEDISKLGIEPLSKEFTLSKLEEIFFNKPNSTVRNVLLDQSLIVGIGNIYVSEIMFMAGLAPGRLAGKLKKEEIKKIRNYTIKILKKAIELRGTSDSDYRDTDGAPGGFQKMLKVYNREKEQCKAFGCQGVIRRMKINQRSAYYCDRCQE